MLITAPAFVQLKSGQAGDINMGLCRGPDLEFPRLTEDREDRRRAGRAPETVNCVKVELELCVAFRENLIYMSRYITSKAEE